MELEKVCENLKARGFKAQIFPDGKAAADYLNGAIDGTSVGFGGSVTLDEIGLCDALSAHNETHWHWKGGAGERGAAMTTEVYVSSVNGLSEDGELINIDGRGNRVAATLYGHKRVYFVVGQNKIAPTYEEALWRARNIAAPKNAQRLGMKTPCAVRADRCYDCKSPERICRGLVVLWRPMLDAETEVLLVRENLGL
ncbi:MAG: lactate utilization protein [Oscillibacter sp.]|nr:lactate utilization protein [Oscillibacter sp.]